MGFESPSLSKVKALIPKIKASVVGAYDPEIAQNELNEVIKKYGKKLKKNEYILYELQAYIYFALEQDTKSRKCALKAKEIKPNKKKYLDPLITELLDTQPESYKKVQIPPSRFEGWLVFVGLGIVVTPILILNYITELQSIRDQAGGLSLLGENYVNTAVVANFLTLILVLVLGYFFFMKKKIYPTVNTVYWGLVGIISVGTTLYLAGILTELGNQSAAGELYGDMFRNLILACIWVPYFNKSLRVKGTFLN